MTQGEVEQILDLIEKDLGEFRLDADEPRIAKWRKRIYLKAKEARTRTVLKEYKEIVRMMGETYSLDQGSAERDEEMKRRLKSLGYVN